MWELIKEVNGDDLNNKIPNTFRDSLYYPIHYSNEIKMWKVKVGEVSGRVGSIKYITIFKYLVCWITSKTK